MTTALGFVPANDHNEAGHPERPGRLRAVVDLLANIPNEVHFDKVEAVAATPRQLARVHTPDLINQVKETVARGDGHLDADTYVTSASFEQAGLAAGTTCSLIDAVMNQNADNAFALVRPPGHHAERRRVGGFCLFNNIAIAARHVQSRYGVERVMIIDFDVHHGNGTQEIFYEEPSVLFVSLHLYHPYFYPGSGSAEEIGEGAGSGATLNIPFSPGAGDKSYEQAFHELVLPMGSQFKPEIILVSAGFDAHWIDPLASAGLSLPGYTTVTRTILDLANDICGGRCVFVLEGGYHLEALSFGVLNVLNVLSKRDGPVDPLGLSPYNEPDIIPLIQRLRTLHLLS